MIPKFHEKELSFLHLRFGYDKTNNWIKKPENILMIHETFKKIGYNNLISKEDWESDWNWYLDVSKSPKNLIDSLELTFIEIEESPKYYKEFWGRRKSEGNDATVYKIVKEIKQIMNEGSDLEVNHEIINDTLAKLISYEFPERKLTPGEANSLLHYLIEIGLHESAYNLISGENSGFEEVNWNIDKDSVLKVLIKSELNPRPWFEDNTK